MAGTFGFNEPFQLNQRRHNLRHRSSTILCGRIRGNTPWPRCRILPSRSNGSPLSLVRACNAPVRAADRDGRPLRRWLGPRYIAGCAWWSGFLDHQLRRIAVGATRPRRGNPARLRNARRATARNVSLGREVLVTRAIGALIIVCGLSVIGAEAVTTIGVHGIAGDLMFVLTGLMFATFGALLRLWTLPRFLRPQLSVCCRFSYPCPLGARWLRSHDCAGMAGKPPASGLAGRSGGPRSNIFIRPHGRFIGSRKSRRISCTRATICAAHRVARSRGGTDCAPVDWARNSVARIPASAESHAMSALGH